MDERDYERELEAAFQRAADACDAVDGDLDNDRRGDRLDLEGPRGKIILTAQRSAKQLWVAAGTEGLRFSHRDGAWREERDGRELFAFLAGALPKLLTLVLLPFALAAAPPLGPVRWAVGVDGIEPLAMYGKAIEAAIGKAAPRAPAWKPGAEVSVHVVSGEGGSKAQRVRGPVDPAGAAPFDAWLARWVLPVSAPGFVMPVTVRWDKPGKGETKEKVPDGGVPTKPPPGLRTQVGHSPKVAGPLLLDEALRSVRLVFASEDACKEALFDLKAGTARTTFWHLDVDAAGKVSGVPQDIADPPPPPPPAEGKAPEAKAPEAKAPEAKAPKFEAPKFEAKAPEAKAPEGKGAEAAVPAAAPTRPLDALETCMQARIATARPKMPSKAAATKIDGIAITVFRP